MKRITFTLLLVAAVLHLQAATGWFNDFLTLELSSPTTITAPGTYWIGATPSPDSGTPLQGTDLGTVDTLKITSCDMKYWSDTQDRTGGAFYYQIKSADGATVVVSPVETIWSQAAIGGNDFQGTVTANLNLLSGLKPATTYQLHVWAKSWGTGQGDSWLSNSGNNYVATFTTPAVMITGANGIPDGTGYATLKGAFDAINLQTDQTGKTIEIMVGASTTETATALLSQPTVASWTSLTIYPTATATIEGSFVGTIIDLSGADKVTINGKLNKTGTAKTLTISHTSNADNGNRTIRFVNDAKDNVIQYCTVKGKCPSTGAGVIFFSTTTGTDGNDGNIIEYCDIDGIGGAAVGIGSAGTSGASNSGNIIRYNNIFDFYLGNASTAVTYGTNIGANNTAWTITGNSFYQTASRSYSATSTFHYGLYVSAATGSGVDFVITDNYIGGSAPQCGGTPWTVTGGLGRPVGLYTSVGTTSASSIQNNTIANFDVTTDFVTNASSAFIGYWHNAGLVNIGTVTGNTIGSTTTTGSINIKFNALAAGSLVVGVNLAGGPVTFSNNKIGGIILDLKNTTNRAHLYGISTSGAAAITITKNLIGSEIIANSIEHKGSTATSTNQSNLRGITVGNTGGSTIDENIIANLTCNSTGATMSTVAIFSNSAANNASISKNTIRDIKTFGTRTNTGTAASIVGIMFNGNTNGNTFGQNTIYNLNNATTTADGVEAYGIYFQTINASASTIERNKIYNITTSSTSTNANIVGINITDGLTTTKNNSITLGQGVTTAVNMSGIRKAIADNSLFYHNTVVLNGSEVGTAGTTSTAAFLRTSSGTDELKNNILINERSNATGNTQKHYVINLNNTTTLTSNNNLGYASGTGTLFGIVGTTDYSTFADWKTGTSLDAASVSKLVEFTGATDLSIAGTSINDVELGAPQLGTVLTDILAASRASTTYMGAYEASNLTGTIPSKTFTVTAPNGTAKVYVTGTFTGKKWDLTNPHELTATANPNEFAGTFACADGVSYKYLNEKGDWDYQEGVFDGSNNPLAGSNRTFNVSDNVPVWYRVNKVTFNATFATAVPNTLFVKGSFDGWTTGLAMTKSGSTFSYVLGGNPGDKYAGNTLYKYYTNDMTNDNWEVNADGSAKANRWTVAPVMNDEIARFDTPISTTGVSDTENGIRIYQNANGIRVEMNNPSEIELFNLNGQLIEKQNATDKYIKNLERGIYIIKINGSARKFII